MGLEHSKIKAVLCMDLDGTLVDYTESAHPRDIEILNNFPQEVLPILATGRSLPSAKDALAINGIFTDGPFPIPSVTINGAVIQLPGEEVIKVEYLDRELLEQLTRFANQFSSTTFFYYQPTKCYLLNPAEINNEISKMHYLEKFVPFPEVMPDQINKVMAIDKNLDAIEQIRQHTQGLPAEIGTSLPHILEFSPLGVTKAKGAQFLLDAMGIEDLPIFAVGDGENDLTLKTIAQQFFVPSTAQAHIQQQADQVIDRSENGILSPILDLIR